MATTSNSSNNKSSLALWWSQWWPYVLVLGALILFPFVAGLTIGNPAAAPEGTGFFESIMLKAESG